MRSLRLPLNRAAAIVLPLLLWPVSVLAVYAPVPEQDQGKALVTRLGASLYQDSNIFGSATGEIDSLVYSLRPGISYNGSLTDQTFLSAGYDLTYDHVADRPGKQNLTSHALSLRVAHSFSQDTALDVSDRYQIAKNPPSLLAGVPLNTDQSFKANEFNARLDTAANEKTGLVFKLRHASMAYDTASLAAQLDRDDVLAGFEAAFALLPETKLVGEYRYLGIAYSTGGQLKDKRSHFLLAGVDHKPGEKMTLTARFGFEDRTREGAPDDSAPSAELSARYAYAEGSFLAGGYAFAIEEPSDVVRFTDTRVNRLFVNLQHRLSGLLTASGSLTFEPSSLQGRPGVRDVDERTSRLGFALSWMPSPQWLVSATLDFDRVDSDDNSRDQDRNRYGLNAQYSF
jgi:hypothetical protein